MIITTSDRMLIKILGQILGQMWFCVISNIRVGHDNPINNNMSNSD